MITNEKLLQKGKYKVYAHTIHETGKTYIGITGNRINERWQNGLGYKDNQAFFSDILKYGWFNIEHIILAQVETKKLALELEQYFIDKYKTDNPMYGYNIDSEQYRKLRYQPIYQYTKDLKFVAKYENIADASRKTGFNASAISCCANGKQKHHRGFRWFKESDLTNKKGGVLL